MSHSLTQFAVYIPAQVHPVVFKPNDLFPRRLHNLPDNVLIGHAIGAFPGVEHMKDGLVHGVLGIYGGQPALGGAGMGFLRMRDFRNGDDICPGSSFQYLGSASQAGSARSDDQGFGPHQLSLPAAAHVTHYDMPAVPFYLLWC